MKTKRDRMLIFVVVGICSAVIIGDLGMHFLFGPKDTPPKTAVNIIEKLESKNKIYNNDVGRLIIQNDSGSDIMRPGGWSGQFANYSHP
ncbi:MAG: hypothetical protein ACREAE_06830 [Nitrosopumilaceae archaeon]